MSPRVPPGRTRHDRSLYRVGRAGPWRVGRRHEIARSVDAVSATWPTVVEIACHEVDHAFLEWLQDTLVGAAEVVPLLVRVVRAQADDALAGATTGR